MKHQKKIVAFKKTVRDFIHEQTHAAGRQIIAFGIILTINYPLYYLIWLHTSYQSYENLSLRLSASFFCFLLIFKNFWPKQLKEVFPIYWYLTVLYCLPFFFTFMSLKNHASTMWLMNSVSVLFFLLLLFDVLSVIVLVTMGVLLGWYFYYLTSHEPFSFNSGTVNLSGIIATFGAAFVIGSIFAHNKEKIKNEKLRAIAMIGESIAHELRTPLRIISSAANGLNKYLPQLIETYNIAQKNNLPIPKISTTHYMELSPVLSGIGTEVESAFNFINMLLTNANQSKVEPSQNLCSIVNCVERALLRYPFDINEDALVSWESNHGFLFKGDELLVIHVLFNLLKNSLYHIRAARKGNISIRLENHEKVNILFFRDTGAGISAKVLPHIFDRFFSRTYHGTGIGLSYCKLVMQNLGGDITCRSKEGEFTEFMLTFPKVK